MTMLKTNENGRSMIEMLGVLAIIGVLSVGGIAGYSKAMNKFKTNKVADNVSMIVANVKTLYAQQKNYGTAGKNGTALTTAKAIDLGIIPDELVKTESKAKVLRNAYNGKVFVGATKSVDTDTDLRAFYVSFNGLSKEACVALATNDWGSSYSSGLIAIKVGNGATGGTLVIDNDEAAVTATSAADMKMGCAGVARSIACPGGTTSSVPMKVTDAASACACNSGNTCAIVWKYY